MSALRISVPGQPPRLVADPDPWGRLTPHQRRVAVAVLARRGHRTYAAQDLGISVTSVQTTVARIAVLGLRLPASPRRGPDLRPRKGKPEPCGAAMPRAGTTCARGAGHIGAHRSLAAEQRERAAQATWRRAA